MTLFPQISCHGLVHGASDYVGHGPGVDTILSTREGRPGYEIVEKANIVDWWGLK